MGRTSLTRCHNFFRIKMAQPACSVVFVLSSIPMLPPAFTIFSFSSRSCWRIPVEKYHLYCPPTHSSPMRTSDPPSRPRLAVFVSEMHITSRSSSDVQRSTSCLLPALARPLILICPILTLVDFGTQFSHFAPSILPFFICFHILGRLFPFCSAPPSFSYFFHSLSSQELHCIFASLLSS